MKFWKKFSHKYNLVVSSSMSVSNSNSTSSSSICSMNGHIKDRNLVGLSGRKSRQAQRQSGPGLKKTETYEVSRGEVDPTDAWDYSGFFRNAFRVKGGPIWLKSLGFFGPVNADMADYEASIIVETPSFALKYPWYYDILWGLKSRVKIYGAYKQMVTAEKGKMIDISFEDNPILIRPQDEWIGITFSFEGKDVMGRIKPGEQKNTISVPVADGSREFVFMSGSGQMPILRFSLA